MVKNDHHAELVNQMVSNLPLTKPQRNHDD